MKKRLVSIILAVVLTCSIFSGCSIHKAQETPVAVSVLLGNHACSKRINVTSPFVQEAVSRAVSTYGYVSIIAVDGDPNIIASGNCDIPNQYKNADSQKLAADTTARTLALLDGLDEVYADSPEVDTLEALRLAVRSLNEAPSESEKMIVVLDSGVCTTGLCDFHNNIMSADAVAVADALEELQAIPDLTNTRVIWLHLGEVEAPQEALSPRQLNKLRSIWEEIVKRGGGVFEYKDVPAPEEEQNNNLPVVTPIDMEREVPVTFDPVNITRSDNLFEEPQFLREEQVRFVADSDVLVDPEGAEGVLAPIAEYMQEHEDFRLLLVGTTAGDDAGDYSIALSNSRAKRIKTVLVSRGVSEERIDTIGMGGKDPWHIYNVGTSGELAAQNRKVVLLDAASDQAKELMGTSP